MGRGTGLNVFANRNISPYREWNHSSELNCYRLRYPGFHQTRNPQVNSSTSADRGAVDAAFRSFPYFLSLQALPRKETGYCPQGFTGATIEPDGRQERSLFLSVPPSLSLTRRSKQSIKSSLYTAPHEQCAQMYEICKRQMV